MALERYRSLRHALRPGETLSQEEFDRLRQGVMAPAPAQPKGINPAPHPRVGQHLDRAQEPVTATDLAARLGMDRTTALRYLDYLQRTGEVREEVCFGMVGRPARMFRLAGPVHQPLMG